MDTGFRIRYGIWNDIISLLVELIQVLIMSEAIKRQDTFKEKLLLCIFACIFLVLAIVLPFAFVGFCGRTVCGHYFTCLRIFVVLQIV